MPRFLPLSFLCLTTWAAWAQAPAVAPLAPVVPALRVPAPDSGKVLTSYELRSLSCPTAGVVITTTDWTPPPFLTLQPMLTRMAGVQATPHSGAPGDWATVRLRGGSSLQGTDQPLYVIDGLPALNADFAPGLPTQNPGYGYGSGPQLPQAGANPLLSLPPEDVERVTVLQGTDAARYGAQGSNGVIEITTRRGGSQYRRQPLRVRYAGFGGVQQVRQRYELLTARQYAELANEAWQNTPRRATAKPFSDAALAELGQGTDWQSELFRPAALHSHHFSVDGSTDPQTQARTALSTRYLLAADYLHQQGVVENSGLKRYALRLNLDQRLGPVRLFANAAASRITQTLPGQGAVAQALLAPPTLPARAADGSYYQTNRYYQSGGYATFLNPLAIATEAGYDGTTRRLLLQGGATYSFRDGLKATLSASREDSRVSGTTRALYLATPRDGQPPTPADVLLTELAATTTVAQLQLSYEHYFDSDHHLQLLATAGRQVHERSQSSYQATPAYTNGYYRTKVAYALPSTSLSATYAYAAYELLASLRADFKQVETLVTPFVGPRDAPTTWLPAAEARWHLHRAGFFLNHRKRGQPYITERRLSTATLWLGLGQTSNTGLVSTGLTTVPQGAFGGSTSPAVPVTALARTTQLEGGLRTGFWKDKLYVDLTAYRRSTDPVGLAQFFGLPGSTGYGGYFVQREARLRNQGLQLTIRSNWRLGRLDGSSRLVAALQQQRVLAIDDQPGGPVPGLAVGEAPHPYLLFERLPVTALGSVRFANPDQDGYLTDNDARYQGTALPTQLYTFSQSLSLLRLTLDVQLDALAGHQLLNTTLALLETPTGNTNGTTRLLDRWTPTRYNPDVPRASPTPYTSRYDNSHPQSADHLRLSQLTLSYALRPAGRPHPLSVWVGAQNLFVLTKYQGFDPNVSSGGATQLAAGYDTNAYPVPRTWLVGVRASF